ncbi:MULTISPECIES: SpoIIE family protein phosphatase [Aphanothece]|uniref:SpoIIE family protein phosphatase n=1 Tax=Aphanothece TaxID=1121 RepID=UPI003984B439
MQDRTTDFVHPDTRRAENYERLIRLAGEIGREPDLDSLLYKILEKSRPWIGAEACSIFLEDKKTGELCINSAYGESAPQLNEIRIPAGVGIVGKAMETKSIIRVDDVSKDPRFYSKVDKTTGWVTKALIAAPLLDGNNCIGVIEFLNPIDRPSFDEEDEEEVEYFASLVSASLVRIQSNAAAIERAQVQRDLDLARDMQIGILPTRFPTQAEFANLDLYAALDPATEVSGDLYDFFPSGDGRLFFLVGDVAGKGVAAGLFMAIARTLIRSTARQYKDPVEILSQVNAQLYPENAAMLFVTIILGVYNPDTGEVVYAQGGHNPALYIKETGSCCYEDHGGQPLGVFKDASFVMASRHLGRGETFFIYTDGITEAMNEDHAQYGEDRLKETIQSSKSQSAKELVNDVLANVRGYVGAAEQSDDITVLALRRT